MLEIKELQKFYGFKKALKDVSFTVGPGEIVGLFGENGAGKTTLLKSILGLLVHGGEVTLDGERVTHKNIERLSFATCEHSFFPSITVMAHRSFYMEHFPKWRDKRFWALMDFFKLKDYQIPSYLSTGQKNQLEVILALCQGADYILMDEPFSGNDLFNREDFYKVLMGILEPQETVILSTHLIEEVENFVSRAILLKKGAIVGDAAVSDLEDAGESLVDFVKRSYGYSPDRVRRVVEKLAEDEEGGEE